ncbi:MAG: hypothetical protein M1814_003040 [Vezdaea aestivalis]|nr:MAG: hypothetical protein M1814_003040 [Vezdaea aestivalis]
MASTATSPPAAENPYLLAADNGPSLIPMLQANPSIASAQDPHGYSLLHAAASYNHNDLVRRLVRDFAVNVDIQDEDGESPLFWIETVEAAKVLVEELNANLSLRNHEGCTVIEKLADDADFPLVVAYLLDRETGGDHISNGETAPPQTGEATPRPPPVPGGISINLATIDQQPDAEGDIVDPELKSRIEELAQRNDFEGQEGQRQLRDLVTDAVRDHVVDNQDDREVRRRLD